MFKKYNIPWNKGKKGVQVGWSKGKTRPPFSEEWKKKMSEANKGKRMSEESKAKLSRSLIGKNKGKVRSLEFRRKVSNSLSGSKNYNWKGGITKQYRLIRKSVEYKIWRESVMRRDNHTCIWCGDNKDLQVDHIKPFALYPELRFAIDNGRVLCQACHKTTDTWGNKTKIQ